MTTNISKTTSQIARVSRRRFLSRGAIATTGAIATAGATLLPQQTIASDKPLSLEQMARALHEIVGRHSDLYTPYDFGDYLLSGRSQSSNLDFAMETLRDASVEEIQCVLSHCFESAW